MSHAAGVGKPLSREQTRMLMALRINVLAKGYRYVLGKIKPLTVEASSIASLTDYENQFYHSSYSAGINRNKSCILKEYIRIYLSILAITESSRNVCHDSYNLSHLKAIESWRSNAS